jgi:antitoxin CcdA
MLNFENAPKRAANLTLNARALEMARELGMNVSQTVDALLQAEVKRRYREKWRAENKEAIAAYNARVKQDGVFGDSVRDF